MTENPCQQLAKAYRNVLCAIVHLFSIFLSLSPYLNHTHTDTHMCPQIPFHTLSSPCWLERCCAFQQQAHPVSVRSAQLAVDLWSPRFLHSAAKHEAKTLLSRLTHTYFVTVHCNSGKSAVVFSVWERDKVRHSLCSMFKPIQMFKLLLLVLDS